MTGSSRSPSLLSTVQKRTVRLAFQLPRPSIMRPSPCLSLHIRTPRPDVHLAAAQGWVSDLWPEWERPAAPETGAGFQPTCVRGCRGCSPRLTGRALGWVPRSITIGRASQTWGGALPSEPLSLAELPMGACHNRALCSSHNRRHPAGSACAGPPC